MLAALFNLYKNTRTQLENVVTRLAEEQQDGAGARHLREGCACRLLAVRRGHRLPAEPAQLLPRARGGGARAAPRLTSSDGASSPTSSSKILKARKVRVELRAAGQGLGGAPLRSEEAAR